MYRTRKIEIKALFCGNTPNSKTICNLQFLLSQRIKNVKYATDVSMKASTNNYFLFPSYLSKSFFNKTLVNEWKHALVIIKQIE